MLKSVFGPADPFTIEDPRFGRLDARPGSVWNPTKTPYVVEGERIGRFATLSHERWETPAGEAEVVENRHHVRRRQHDGRVRLAGRTWHLRQRSWFSADVLRDGERLARLRVRRGGGRRHGVEDWSGAPDALDAGIAHLLALRHGVGAKGFASDAFDLPLLPVEWLRSRRETLP